MTEVIGVRFKKVGKVYYFDPCGLKVKTDMAVIVETARGLEYGEVSMPNSQVEDEKIVQPLKKVVRLATEADKKTMEQELSDGVLSLLGIGDFLNVTVSKMSGGMKKRLSIGCAMAKKPPILLLDEPTAALDLSCKQSIATYLRHYKKSGGLLLLTTHDVMELDLCDAWYIIRDGVLMPFTYDGDIQKLVESL
jgi:ABC-2 type transport system ATP-binding protein